MVLNMLSGAQLEQGVVSVCN